MTTINPYSKTMKNCLSRDRFLLRPFMQVWYFDPYNNFALKTGMVAEVSAYGPTLAINGSSFVYSRDAVWTTEAAALADGPPRHIYGPLSRSRTSELKNHGHTGVFTDDTFVQPEYEVKSNRAYSN